MLVRCAGIVGLHDAVADPISKIGRLAGRGDTVVEPVRRIGLARVRKKSRLYLRLAPARPDKGRLVAHVARDEFTDKVGGAFH